MPPRHYQLTPPAALIDWDAEQREWLDRRNFDEAAVGSYDLPPALQTQSGEVIHTAQAWQEQRCPEVLALFRQHVYGAALPVLEPTVEIVEEGEAYGGNAWRRQVEVGFAGWSGKIRLIVYLPRPLPEGGAACFLGLSFFGNEASFADPAVEVNPSWFIPSSPLYASARASEATRGFRTSRWPIEKILARGYGVATAYYGDIEPDYPGGDRVGVRSLFPPELFAKGDASGSIATWAWGLSRLMDVLERLPGVDTRRVILTGHSRLGKTALWAAAQDERFAAVVSNNSGCGGAAISRRNFGETLAMLSRLRDYWFCPNAEADSLSDATMPVDQHLLLAAIAPRPVLVGSAEDDHGADPKGEFLGAWQASEVFRLLGAGELGTDTLPPLNTLTGEGICYYIRPGAHDITPEDWGFHLDFADRHISCK